MGYLLFTLFPMKWIHSGIKRLKCTTNITGQMSERFSCKDSSLDTQWAVLFKALMHTPSHGPSNAKTSHKITMRGQEKKSICVTAHRLHRHKNINDHSNIFACLNCLLQFIVTLTLLPMILPYIYWEIFMYYHCFSTFQATINLFSF